MNRFKQFSFPVQVGITVAVMAIVFLVGFYQYPGIKAKNAEIQQKRTDLDALTAEIQKGLNLEKKLPELEREIANLEAQLEELKTIMPPARVDSEIVSKLESVAKRSRLAIRTLVPATHPRKKDFYDEYPITIDVSANYHDLAKFFDRVAHLPRIFNVTGVTLRQYRGASGSAVPYSLDASFTAVTFIYREEAPPPPAPKKKAAPPPQEDNSLSG